MTGSQTKTSNSRIFFIHGLEGTSKGRKATLLRKVYKNVECKDMHLPKEMARARNGIIAIAIPLLAVLAYGLL